MNKHTNSISTVPIVIMQIFASTWFIIEMLSSIKIDPQFGLTVHINWPAALLAIFCYTALYIGSLLKNASFQIKQIKNEDSKH